MLRQLTIAIALWTLVPAGAQDKSGDLDPELEIFYEANRLYNIKVYTLAAEKFREFLRAHPKHAKVPDAKYGLALSLYEKAEFAEAEKVFGELAKVSSNPNLSRILLMRGQCLLKLDRPADASAAFTAGSIRKGSPNPEKARHLAGLVEARTGEKKWEEVVTAAGQFLKLQNAGADPLVGRVRFHLATAHHELAQFEDAATVAAQLIAATGGPDKTPFGQPALFLLAESRRELGNFTEARKYYEFARKREGPLAADALFRLGFVHFREKRFDDAIRSLELLQKEQPGGPLSGPASLYLGRCFFEKKDFKRADATLKTLPSAEAAFWRTRALEQDKRIDESLAALAAAVAKFPQDPLLPDLLFAQGGLLMEKEDFIKAGEAFARVEKSFPEWPNTVDAVRLQAFCLHRTAKHQASLEACERYLAEKAERPESRIAEMAFLKAENLLLLDKPAEAEAAYADFAAKHKAHPQVMAAQYRIGEIRYRKEDWKGAGEILRRVDPGKIADKTLATQLDFMIGDSAFRAGGDDAGAERHYAKFVAEKPVETLNRDTALLNSAILLRKRKNNPGAAAGFTRLLGEYPASAHRPRALLERGMIEYDGANLPAARASFQEIVAKHAAHPLRIHAVYRLGWVSLKEKKAPEARGHFLAVTTAKTLPGLISDSHYQIALIAIEGKAFPEARQHLEKLAAGSAPEEEGGPAPDSVLYELGYVQSQMEDWPAAALSLARLLKEFPKSPRSENALYELAWCEESRGSPAEAVKRYGELLAKFPASESAGSAAVKLAELHYTAGDIDAALGVLGKWIAKLTTQDPELAARASFRLGWCQLRKEAFLEAAKSFESVLGNTAAEASIVPASAYQAAEARLSLKEYPAAAVHYERAAKSAGAEAPIPEQATLRLGECHGLTARWTDSERVFREFARGFPNSALLRRSQLGLGWALENQKRFPDAIAEYRKALGAGGKEKPKDETAARSQFQIGECCLAQKEFDLAIGEFVKVELHYGFPQWSSKALLEIGNALTAKGDRAAARERFEEVIKRFPGSDAATVAKQFLQQNP